MYNKSMYNNYTRNSQGIEVACRWCKNIYQLDFTPEQEARWRAGEIQNVASQLNAGQRELLISGTCNTCFDKMFAEGDYED